jgi:hypothetical protein
MKRAVLYLRVSTVDQTTANQERELREVSGLAAKMTPAQIAEAQKLAREWKAKPGGGGGYHQ